MAEQAGLWLTSCDPHAGLFTAGSEDTELWSSLEKDTQTVGHVIFSLAEFLGNRRK